MSIKHTPGPWIVDDRHIHPRSGLTYPDGQEPETDVILMVDTDQHESGLLNETDKANLRLAAAAPELLEACKNLLSLFDSGWAVRDTSDDASPGFALRQIEPMRKLSFAKGAIAKAETI